MLYHVYEHVNLMHTPSKKVLPFLPVTLNVISASRNLDFCAYKRSPTLLSKTAFTSNLLCWFMMVHSANIFQILLCSFKRI